jgi:predicted esterase YcpF (UPF0227 family)
MAALVQRHPAVHWWCPQLPASPQAALQMVLDEIAGWPQQAGYQRMAVIGSSLGGFYATAVAERTGCKAVLLNPRWSRRATWPLHRRTNGLAQPGRALFL